MQSLRPNRRRGGAFAVAGLVIGAVLAFAVLNEAGGPRWLHNVHVGAVAAAIGWILVFAFRGHR